MSKSVIKLDKLKELFPLETNVQELVESKKYVFVFDFPLTKETCVILQKELNDFGIKALILPNGVKIYKLED